MKFRSPRGTGKYTVYKTANGGKVVATVVKGVVKSARFFKGRYSKSLTLLSPSAARRAATCKICYPTENGTIKCFGIPCDWIVIESLQVNPSTRFK